MKFESKQVKQYTTDNGQQDNRRQRTDHQQEQVGETMSQVRKQHRDRSPRSKRRRNAKLFVRERMLRQEIEEILNYRRKKRLANIY